MNTEPQFFVEVPDWLKAVKDDDVYAAILTLLTEWETTNPKSVSNLATELKETFGLSEKQAEEALKLMVDNGVLARE